MSKMRERESVIGTIAFRLDLVLAALEVRGVHYLRFLCAHVGILVNEHR